MIRGLFINNRKAKDSIFESGKMVYDCLKQSKKIVIDYCEVDVENRQIRNGYDFYFFNYHPVTMGWLETGTLKKDLGLVITMILEVAPGDAFVMCPEKDFDIYCALDPTIKERDNLYAFPRPLEKIGFQIKYDEHEIPVIGSFGFATKGKGFQHVINAVNQEFQRAIVKINIPYGDFVPESEKYALFLSETCKKLAKPGIDVIVTHDFMTKEQLIKWCASNTLNCFLYDREMPGLSATTDQAIVSKRPLAVADNNTFRHITAYLPPYPKFSLKDSIEKSLPIIEKMEEDWMPEIFTTKFEKIIFDKLSLQNNHKESDKEITLSIKKNSLKNKIELRVKKYKRKLKKMSFKSIFHSIKKNEII
jgi:hypothetical protein